MSNDKNASLWRLGIGGFFMGLANLVPGVSGGTMILALGLYDQFIGAFSDLTRLKFSKRAFILVGTIVGVALLTILFMSGVIQFLMESYRPEMLGLFIGLTLGGAPLLFKEVRPFDKINVIAIIIGLLVMVFVAFFLRPGAGTISWVFLFFGGVVGSSAMILPGISGSYLLLVLGLYLPVISAINEAKHALKLHDMNQLFDIGFDIILPFAIGIAVGMIALSNILKVLLEKHPRPTHGFLLGFLLGSVLGLYPFKVPTFDKLVRHAVPVSQEKSELRVIGHGWGEGDFTIVENLKKVETENLQVKFLQNNAAAPKVRDIDYARSAKAVMITYDVDVADHVRSAASNKEMGKVPLIIVPNTSFSFGRLLLVLILSVIGFFTTFVFGRFKNFHE